MNILILGGTGFLGPALVEAARPHGHEITLFNRGKTNPGLFPELEKLQGDRDPKKGDGLKALANRQWDVVFDDCGYYPRHVKASAELLAPNVAHYVYVSSISAYARNDIEGMDEDAECATMPDPTLESMGPRYEFYGPLKKLCEEAAEAAFPGRATIVRPGFIVGPSDPTDRFTYWPARMQRGGQVLVPQSPRPWDCETSFIDARDLADFACTCAEKGHGGAFNCAGPDGTLTMDGLVWGCRAAFGNQAELVPVDEAWLLAQQVQPWMGLPLWIPQDPSTAGAGRANLSKAFAHGLRCRPLADTARDTIADFEATKADRPADFAWGSGRAPGISAEREAELLRLWAARTP